MTKQKQGKPLFILEMANNHMGDTEHGLRIIREMHKVCKKFPFDFAFKFQYRQLDTFIHPDYKERMDLKFVKRFSETKLTEEQFLIMKAELEKLGFLSMCTPFDEESVGIIENHDYDIIKIASCSFTDWPLLERVVASDKPIIASTAGATLEEINNVVSFFEHRDKSISVMHCIAEYPTQEQNMQLNQIDILKEVQPNIKIGFSTHEDPSNTDAVKMAIAKGAVIFEKHVGIKTDKYDINGYSATPEQIEKWLQAAEQAYKMCGLVGKRSEFTQKEKDDLRALQRGIFASKDIKKGEIIQFENIYLAMPSQEGQLLANDFSKYNQFTAQEDINKNESVLFNKVKREEIRARVAGILQEVKKILQESHTVLPENASFELSHHYGIDTFYKFGATIVNCVNREYCKKLIILTPGQKHPMHFHKKKEETFHVLHGDLTVTLGLKEKTYKKGDTILVARGVKHGFTTKNGAVFEEISTTHYKNDSFYDDDTIEKNVRRKRELTYWQDI